MSDDLHAEPLSRFSNMLTHCVLVTSYGVSDQHWLNLDMAWYLRQNNLHTPVLIRSHSTILHQYVSMRQTLIATALIDICKLERYNSDCVNFHWLGLIAGIE